MENFYFRAQGIQQARVRFSRLGAAAINARPAFDTLAELVMAIEKRIFEGQGRRGGGSWKRDTPEWAKRKLDMGLDDRINIASGALMTSVTEPNAPGQILDISRNSLRFGSNLPQARPSQRERPFVKFTASDRVMFADVIRSHLISAWNGGQL